MEFVDERIKDDKRAHGLNSTAYRSQDNENFKVKCIIDTLYLAVNMGSYFKYARNAMKDEDGVELKDQIGIYKNEICSLCYGTYKEEDISRAW